MESGVDSVKEAGAPGIVAIGDDSERGGEARESTIWGIELFSASEVMEDIVRTE